MNKPLRISASMLIFLTSILSLANDTTHLEGFQWQNLEWQIKNITFEPNPFDLAAHVSILNIDQNATKTTGMFYDKENIWKFRFTADVPGTWRFRTFNEDTDLDGHRGIIEIAPNREDRGFVIKHEGKWARGEGYRNPYRTARIHGIPHARLLPLV
jgi:hypothetical protein